MRKESVAKMEKSMEGEKEERRRKQGEREGKGKCYALS